MLDLSHIRPGLTGTAALLVGPEDTAPRVGSGRIAVLATPVMINLIEAAALAAVEQLLPTGHQSLGSHLDVRHFAATPVGLRVTATAEVTSVEGRAITFRVQARDEREPIGSLVAARTSSTKISRAASSRLLKSTPSVAPTRLPPKFAAPKLSAARMSENALPTRVGNSVFIMTERGAPMTPAGFRKMLSRLAVTAKFQFPVHPHMLRHACGYKLANDGRDTRALQHYLGHKNIMHTVRYTELSPERFKDFWED